MSKFRIIALLIFFLGGSLFADTIILSNGQTLTGKIENQTATDIFIRTPQGLRRVPKAQVARITYDEALKKQQELQQKLLLEQQKKQEAEKLEEQQKQEQQKKLEDEKRQADQNKKAEEEALKQKKNESPPYLRHDIEVWAGLGVQHLTSGVVGLQQKHETILAFAKNSGIEIRDRRSADVGSLLNLGFRYNWNRISILLNTEVGRSKISSSTIQRQKLNRQQSEEMGTIDLKNAELYSPIDYKSGDLAIGFLSLHSKSIDIKPFVGGRKQQYSVKTDIRSFGTYVFLPMTAYMQTQVESRSSSSGLIGGIELLQPRQLNKLAVSFTIGYYLGTGQMSTHRNFVFYNDGGDTNMNRLGYRYNISVKGPFTNLRLTLPVNDRFDVSCAFSYQQYNYRFTDLNADVEFKDPDLKSVLTYSMNKDFIAGNSATKEIIRSVDFRTTYRFEL